MTRLPSRQVDINSTGELADELEGSYPLEDIILVDRNHPRQILDAGTIPRERERERERKRFAARSSFLRRPRGILFQVCVRADRSGCSIDVQRIGCTRAILAAPNDLPL